MGQARGCLSAATLAPSIREIQPDGNSLVASHYYHPQIRVLTVFRRAGP